MEEVKIPAGLALTDMNIEFFTLNGELFFLQHGEVHHFMEMDTLTAELIRRDLDKHHHAVDALEQMGIIDPIEQLKQYCYCRFGDFDDKADITPEGISVPEYVNCGKRNICKFEGRLCAPVQALNGSLTHREIEVCSLVSLDLPDKIIADRLHIATHTVEQHRKNIEHKIGCHTKVGIAVFAAEHHLV